MTSESHLCVPAGLLALRAVALLEEHPDVVAQLLEHPRVLVAHRDRKRVTARTPERESQREKVRERKSERERETLVASGVVTDVNDQCFLVKHREELPRKVCVGRARCAETERGGTGTDTATDTDTDTESQSQSQR